MLIDKWKQAAQEIVMELHAKVMRDNASHRCGTIGSPLLYVQGQCTLTQIIDQFGISHTMIGYSAETESFE